MSAGGGETCCYPAPQLAPRVSYGISVQVPRDPGRLIRKTFDDEDLHNLEKWRKFGGIARAEQF